MDRFNQSVNERITADDMNRPGLIATKGVLRDFFGPLTSGGLDGFTTAELDQGILWGLDVTPTGAAKTVDVSPGAWLGFDAAIVNLYDNPRTMGRKEVAETGIAIADATATFEKLYLISVPTQRASLEANADTETRDIKNPTTGVLSTQSVAKRISPVLPTVTVTAGTEVALGVIDLTDTPTHDKWTGTFGIDVHAPPLPTGHIPVAIVFKDDTNNVVAGDIHDARQITSLRPSPQGIIHGSATYPQSQEGVVSGFGLPKAGTHLNGLGAGLAPNNQYEFNVRIPTFVATGRYLLTFQRAFTVANQGCSVSFEGTVARVATYRHVSASTMEVNLYDSSGVLTDLLVGERINVQVYGELV